MGQRISYAVGRPHSNMICMHTGMFAVPWPDERIHAVDKWLFQCVPYAFKRQSKAINALPIVSDIVGVDKVVFTSCR